MPKLPGVNYLDAVRALEKLSFRIARQGKHIIMTDGNRVVTILDKALKSDKAFAQYWLNYLGNPDYPRKPKDEDDLEVFWDDEDFLRRSKA